MINVDELIKKLIAAGKIAEEAADAVAAALSEKVVKAANNAESRACADIIVDPDSTENADSDGRYRDEPIGPAGPRPSALPADAPKKPQPSAPASSRQEGPDSSRERGYGRRFPALKVDPAFQRISDMQRIEINGRRKYLSSEEIFYRQAVFMADFEDDYVPNVPRWSRMEPESFRYGVFFVGYRNMSAKDLRSYFTWRTKLRRDGEISSNLSFALVYCAELVNCVGADSPEDAFMKLCSFTASYSAHDRRLEPFAKRWLRDMAAAYALPPELVDRGEQQKKEAQYAALTSPESYSDEELFDAIAANSQYDIASSRLMKLHLWELRTVCAYAYRRAIALDENGVEKFVGRMQRSPYDIFGSAPYFRRKAGDAVYEFSPFYRYVFNNGKWYLEHFVSINANSVALGELMRRADFMLRKHLKLSSTLKDSELPPVYTELIAAAIKDMEHAKREKERDSVQLDLSKLDSIRTSALETQNLLIIDEPGEPADEPDSVPADAPDGGSEPESPAEAASSGPAVACPADLTEAERTLLVCLLEGRPYADELRALGVLPSMAADSANEKLYDLFGDTVVADGGSGLEIIEDYAEELKGMLGLK